MDNATLVDVLVGLVTALSVSLLAYGAWLCLSDLRIEAHEATAREQPTEPALADQSMKEEPL